MEHYRRLGFADEVRSLGLPADFPTDVAYFTRFATHELARFRLPSAREARESVRRTVRVVERRRAAPPLCRRSTSSRSCAGTPRRCQRVSMNYGWRLTDFSRRRRS